ncbi:MAG: hypothetical protein ACK4Z0_03255 [Sphingomonadaceae bacterium]
MTIHQLAFLTFMFGAIGLALSIGGRDERLAAILIVVAAVMTPIMEGSGYTSPEVGVLIVDSCLFFGLGWIALKSTRFWPMWAAGLQLGALFVHLAAIRLPHLSPGAYFETLLIWSYAVLAALAIGAWIEVHGRRDRGDLA